MPVPHHAPSALSRRRGQSWRRGSLSLLPALLAACGPAPTTVRPMHIAPNSPVYRSSAGYRRAEAAFISGRDRECEPLLKPLSDAGDNRARFMLATIIERRPATAMAGRALLRRAAEQGEPCSMAELGSRIESGAAKPRFAGEGAKLLAAARPQLQSAACAGDRMAQLYLGLAHLAGVEPGEQAKSPAALWIRRAADAGYADASFRLSRLYFISDQQPEGWDMGPVYLTRAARQGLPRAQADLARRTMTRDFMDRDPEEAVRWYRRAAEQGDAYSQRCLAISYQAGHGIERSPAKAVYWYRLAAEQGDAGAQSGLGYCLYSGTGCRRDVREAARWFRRSALQGDAKGQHNLGVAYMKGIGVSRAPALAAYWLKKAAAQGDRGAAETLKLLPRSVR